jgi:hypothetical protein
MLIISVLDFRNSSVFNKFFIGFLLLISVSLSLSAQNNYVITHNDSLALENVIVERYYKVTSKDCRDTTGGILPKGSIVYRIYIDLKPGYFLQLVYGNQKHELFLKTSTTFFNNLYCNASIGYNVLPKELNENSVALDSWITLGAASKLHTGIPKCDDTDGSILKKPSFSKADGLTNGVLPTFKPFNLDLNFFNDRKNATVFSTTNGGWAALEGVKGATAENRILIAQLTTNGTLSFDLNIQIGTPTKGSILFVAKSPVGSEILSKCLSY